MVSSFSFFSICLLTFLVNVIGGIDPKRDQLLARIRKPNTPFTNETINEFIELVREKYNYDMIDVLSSSYPEDYPTIPENTNDVQIFHSDSNHFNCIYFDTSLRRVYVYDSKYSEQNRILEDEHKMILQNRYPSSNIVYVNPRTQQYDDTSSGPFVIAYATTLILGENPATYGFLMNAKHSDTSIHLREHIFKMLQERELSLFPRSNRHDINYISPAFDKIHPDILTEINTPNRLFSIHTINLFINLVVATTNFDMLPMNFVCYPELYPVHDDTKDDVQIIYSKGRQSSHAMCIFYNASNRTVIVYDIQQLKDEEKNMLAKRYPNVEFIKYVEPKKKEKGRTSCGPFSIAYATMLIFGYDPETYKFSTSSLTASCFPRELDEAKYMRKHILKMLKSKKLSKFPHD